jgi:hypothetical protein
VKFANVTSMLALFVALGGTSYAAVNSVGKSDIRADAVGKSEIRSSAVGKSELQKNSIGSWKLRTNSVGPSEVKKGAIDSTELTDGGIDAADLSDATRTALTDANAVTFRTAVSAAGAQTAGNAKAIAKGAAASTRSSWHATSAPANTPPRWREPRPARRSSRPSPATSRPSPPPRRRRSR